MSKSRRASPRMALCLSASSFRSVSRRWVGKIESPGSSSAHEQHQHVAVLALAADLLRVHARGLVAVVAVGDQQLGVGERALERGDRGRGRRPARGGSRPLVVGHVRERLLARDLRERLPRAAARVREQAEDGGQVRARRAREVEPVLLRPGMGALVRPDAARRRSPPRARARRTRARTVAVRRGRCSPGAAPRSPARAPGRGRPAGASPSIVCGGAARRSRAGRSRRR